MSESCSAAPGTSRFTLAKVAAVLLGALVILGFSPALRAETSPEAEAATSRSLVNQARAAAGLSPLASHAGADAMAREHAQRMVDRDAIYHNPNLGADADAHGVDWKYIGENVGVGPDAQTVHEAFMNSPDHHKNIVFAEYSVIGVGAARGSDGSIFIAHVFAGLRSPAPAPAAPAAEAAPVPDPAPAAQGSSPAPSQPAPAAPAPVAKVSAAAPVTNALEGGIVDTQVVLG